MSRSERKRTPLHHRQFLSGSWISITNLYWTTIDLTDCHPTWVEFCTLLEAARKAREIEAWSGRTDKKRVKKLNSWLDRVRAFDARARLGKAVA